MDNTSRIVEVATQLAAWTKPPAPPMTAEAVAARLKEDMISIGREEFRNRGKEASAKTYGAILPLVEEFLDLLMSATHEERAAGLKALFTSPSKDMGNAFLSWNPDHSDYDLTWKRYDAVRNAIVFIPIEDSRDTAMANANGNFNFTPSEGIVEEVSRLVREYCKKGVE